MSTKLKPSKNNVKKDFKPVSKDVFESNKVDISLDFDKKTFSVVLDTSNTSLPYDCCSLVTAALIKIIFSLDARLSELEQPKTLRQRLLGK